MPGEPLSQDSQDRWDAVIHAMKDAAGAINDPSGFRASMAAVRQAGAQIDVQEVINAVHVPKEAGEYAQALQVMLSRIPDGWGRWISVDRGWYPIICELDQQLAELYPGYELQQVKEKFGHLRFYWEASPDPAAEAEKFQNPDDPAPAPPPSDSNPEVVELWWADMDAWERRLEEYQKLPDVALAIEIAEGRHQMAEALVRAAEVRAAATCEQCGQPGQLSVSGSWYKTLCAECRGGDYVLASARER